MNNVFEWYSCGEITIIIKKNCFSALQDVLVLPEYHMSKPKPGSFYMNNSVWYTSLEVFEKSQTIKIEGIDIEKIYKRFTEYNYVEMPIYLAISLLGKQQKYTFRVMLHEWDDHNGYTFDYGIRFDGSRLIYRYSEDVDDNNGCYTCDCGEDVDNYGLYLDLFDRPVGTWTETSKCLYCDKETEIDLKETSESVYEIKIEDGRLSVKSDTKRWYDEIIKKATDIANKDGISLFEEPEEEDNKPEEVVVPNTAPKELWGHSKLDSTYGQQMKGTLVIDSYNGHEADVEIPSNIKKKKVTMIGAAVFKDRNDINSVVIPEGILKICYNSFRHCADLTSVSLPNSLKSINGYIGNGGAFEGCAGLTNIELPEGLEKIGDLAFAYCIGLKSVVIPDSVRILGQGIFYGCKNLTSISLPNNDQIYNSWKVFSGCENLTSITIPEKWTYIANGIFSCMKSLKSIVIPDGIIWIDKGAFEGCTSLVSVEMPDSVKLIGEKAFMNCSSLSSVSIPNSVKEIGMSAFENCSALTEVIIPKKVKKIEMFAFKNCTGLTSVVIPKSCKRIHKFAFTGCINLTKVTLPEGVEIDSKAFYNCPKLQL